MEQFKLYISPVTLLSIVISSSVNAHWVVDSAKNNGFIGCDEFIEKTVDLTRNYKIISNWFEETKKMLLP